MIAVLSLLSSITGWDFDAICGFFHDFPPYGMLTKGLGVNHIIPLRSSFSTAMLRISQKLMARTRTWQLRESDLPPMARMRLFYQRWPRCELTRPVSRGRTRLLLGLTHLCLPMQVASYRPIA